ncbi:calmodulin-binding transcription activator 4-like isoform X3 [Olea europaea var. sylvestris]|uniref:calmodulin-binding transcription activator 4-like isoform X3 n=1 Tax=Olea europaea var. sylvestris TaxID=158386 RepID=UPI000C1D851C|nr:calmodulin-binding transcription activator 4-like isoform X3 [Olea europaea var. sylvestris]
MTGTMQGYDINYLVREAQIRWLKPVEVLFILQNHEEHQITHKFPHMPASGSLYLFNKRVLKNFRKDGHSWRRRKDQRTVAEAHERLKVGNAEVLNCYYARGEQNPSFQRRSFWMLDPAYEHIVLVHYRDIGEGTQNARLTSKSSPLSSSILNLSSTSFATQQPDSSVVIGESNEPNQSQPSPASVKTGLNEVIEIHGIYPSDIIERTEVNSSSESDLSEALRKIEQKLSLNDEVDREFNTIYIENEDSVDLENVLLAYDLSAQTSDHSENLLSQRHSGDRMEHPHQLPGPEVNIWGEMLGSSKSLLDVETQEKYEHKLNENGMLLNLSPNDAVREQESYNWLKFDGLGYAQESFMMFTQEVESIKIPAYSPSVNTYGNNLDCYPTFFDQSQIGIPLEDNFSLTISQKQKFTIREISPEWCYSSDAVKVVIIGSFLCSPSECAWACMFGDIEVPAQIIQQGVIRCNVPPHLPGKVTLYITSGNRESCSEVREFEYRAKPSVCTHSNITETGTRKSPEELLLLVRFVQMLLSDPLVQKGDDPESRIDLSNKSKKAEASWSQIIDTLLVGTSTSSNTMEWLLQELLKDRLELWLSSRLRENNQPDSSLSKKEQGIIHMVAGLGFEWALQPILNSGANINFRDINGWTALHWAAHFGREKFVAALIACGASAGAVTDPNSQDPTGKTPAAIAAASGHRGLAGYLSEMALTGHLSSLTLEESELSKGSAALEAERTVNSISSTSSSTNEDQDSLKCTLAAVRNASQAAARIQSAFRAHSFRKRQQREATVFIADASGDEYSILSNDIEGLSAASKVAFRSTRDYNSAALSIQKKYRGWKGRKNFLAFRQKVVKIQAHVRGYQVRRYYKVCWAAGILEKVVLRWRRRGVGLRGFRLNTEFIDESDDEDILKAFRKQKVGAAINEAVSRVLSMVESPKARQQYRRILEKYLQAKAELENPESERPTSSCADFSHMENGGASEST